MRISLAAMAPLIDGFGVSLTLRIALADFGLMDDMVVVLLELVIVFMLRLGTGRPVGVHGWAGAIHATSFPPKMRTISLAGIRAAPNPVMARMRPALTWRYTHARCLPTLLANSSKENAILSGAGDLVLYVLLTAKASRLVRC